jgi:hypothetical protein
VPTLSDNDKFDLTSASWVLVIEKEVQPNCSEVIDAKVL